MSDPNDSLPPDAPLGRVWGLIHLLAALFVMLPYTTVQWAIRRSPRLHLLRGHRPIKCSCGESWEHDHS